jgi:DNA polymerase-4
VTLAGVYRVLHVDLDQFIAAVEMLRRPELAGRPVVVGGHGDPTRRGVVATANYAAREHGIRSGMPLRTAARRCPDAVFLPADNAAYEAASEEVMAVLRGFGQTDGAVVEVLGWDEAFVGVTTDDAVDIAQRIRDEVHTRTRLTCCVGIGDNLLRAKIATTFAKPPVRSESGHPAGTGVFTLTAQNWGAVMGERPTRALWGIGAKTAAKLAERGLHTVRELGAADPTSLAEDLGPALGPWYVQLGQGVSRVKLRGEPWVARSRGHEETFAADLTDWAEVRTAAGGLARRVAADVAAEGRPAARVGVTVRFAPFTTRTRSATLPDPTSDGAAIEAAALAVLDRFTPGRPVRLVGVRVEFAEEAARG